jgi:16S rRNA (guanine1207-N2)-methyltransferase
VIDGGATLSRPAGPLSAQQRTEGNVSCLAQADPHLLAAHPRNGALQHQAPTPVALTLMSEPNDHYFTAEPASAAQRRQLRVHLAGREVIVQTAPGIFCPDRVDIGTAVLLGKAPVPPPTGNLLDIGSGWGPIALTLGLLSPDASIWAVDVNQRALALARDNAKRLGINNFHAMTPGEVPAEIAFEAIWSNPPIRVGKPALHTLLLKWLPRLRPGGAAYLVVQKNLGSDSLQRWLSEVLEVQSPSSFTVGRHATARGYRLLSVRRDG